MIRPTPAARRAGLTLLELMLAIMLLAIVASKAVIVLSSTQEASSQKTSQIVLQSQARRVLERVGKLVMEASEETLSPAQSPPFDSSELAYQVHLGIENGEVVYGEPERISVSPGSGKLVWTRHPDLGPERRIAWTNLVAPFLEGELPNGMDDNGNGLIDEKGLSFTVDRRAVTIRLTLEKQGDGGEVERQTVETTVTCRNLTRSE